MASRVWNDTQQKWVMYPGEINPGDIIQRNMIDTTPMHWVNAGYNKDGRQRSAAHWATTPTIEKILNGPGKGGTMTEIHREGEMELYYKFYDGDFFIIPPPMIFCPAASFCKNHSNCQISTNENRINVRDYYPGNAIFDPHRNLNNNFSCDVVIPNFTTKEAFGLEVFNTHFVSTPKWLSGMPMLEFECHNEEHFEFIKKLTGKTINLNQEENLKFCHIYNLGMLPCYRNMFSCSAARILKLMEYKAATYNVKKNNTHSERISDNQQPPFTGYERWDIWEWDYPRGCKGKLIDKVIRDDPGGVEWTSHNADYYKNKILLSRRTRQKYNLKPTKAEQKMDSNFLTYLQKNMGGK